MIKPFLLLFLLFLPAELFAKDLDTTINLDHQTAGIISAQTTLQELVDQKIPMIDEAYGWDGVNCRDRTILYPKDPRQIIVYWKDSDWYVCSANHTIAIAPTSTPSSIEINGLHYKEDGNHNWKKSLWRVSNGIKIGTSLDELEKIFKGTVRFSSWEVEGDVAGKCCDENPQFPEMLVLRLTDIELSDDDHNKLVEGQEVNTADKVINSDRVSLSIKKKIKVAEIYYRFR